jgi:hypothetical protein
MTSPQRSRISDSQPNEPRQDSSATTEASPFPQGTPPTDNPSEPKSAEKAVVVRPKTHALPIPHQSPKLLTPEQVSAGPPILPKERITLYAASEWETFVLEWAHTLKETYQLVEHRGSSGDLGLDIVGFATDNPGSEWDIFQCKHYEKPLTPTDVWVELGKICHYTYKKEYTCPRRYFLVSPHGVGAKLAKLLKNPNQLRSDLVAGWDQYCKLEITKKGGPVELAGEFRKHVESFNFAIVSHLPTLTLIEQHRRSPYHTMRFGGSLPERPPPPEPPPEISDTELIYVRALLDAYGEHLGAPVTNVQGLTQSEKLQRHFVRSREEFFSAEALRAFTRDNLPEGHIESLFDEVYDGVIDIAESEHRDGYARVLATVSQAKQVPIASHALFSRITASDRGGICHHLANASRLRWIR